MNAEDLKIRTKQLGLDIIKIIDSIPQSQSGRVIGNQLLRSGLSIGANYRAACRARSKADFISKIGISIEEADETEHWLEMLSESGLLSSEKLTALRKEANELVAILTASAKTARKNLIQQKSR